MAVPIFADARDPGTVGIVCCGAVHIQAKGDVGISPNGIDSRAVYAQAFS